MRFETFRRRYPISLADLVVAPLVFREGLPFLADAPLVPLALLRDVTRAAGFKDGALRTALSRLRGSGLVEKRGDRYRRAGLAGSIQRAVPAPGYTLVIFAFSTGDARERQVVREALRLHGFQRLAQNAYVSGRVDTRELESFFSKEGVSDRVFVFHAGDDVSEGLQRRLASLFDLKARARALARLGADLEQLLGAARGADFARRLMYAGPVHYRATFVDEPPLPKSALPPGYPLSRVVELMPSIALARAGDLGRYFRAFEEEDP